MSHELEVAEDRGAAMPKQEYQQLPERLGSARAGDFKHMLDEHRGMDLVLDASEVAVLGGQSLAVLLAARASWQAEGHRLDLINLSEGALHALEFMGIAPETLGSKEIAQ